MASADCPSKPLAPTRPASPPWRHPIALVLSAVMTVMTVFAGTRAQGGLADYDTVIDLDAAAGHRPASRSTAPITLDGRTPAPWDFGAISGDATFEFIIQGDPSSQSGYLAVGANTRSNLRFAQWPGTGQLGFTQLGVADYAFTPPVRSPTIPTHVAYVWSSTQRTMRLYLGGSLTGTASGVDAAFSMPSGSGWLGTNPGGTEAMTGIVHRLTVYRESLPDGVLRAHANAWAGIRPVPRIAQFTADHVFFAAGDLITLTWQVDAAQQLRLDPTPGDVTALTLQGRGTTTLRPSESLSLTLIASNALEVSRATLHLHRVVPAHHPVIAELVADDRGVLADEDGEYSGWVEIYNPTDTAVPLLGVTLSDDPTRRSAWTFPDITLGPRASLVVFASGKDRANAGRPLHTGFRLRNSGEYLALTGPGGAWQHAFSPTFPALAENSAYGIRGGDPDTAGDLPFPTPGQPNPGAATRPRSVGISPSGGTFTNTLTLQLDHSIPETEIRYTLDGSDPAGAGALRYSAPVTLTHSAHVRTIAFAQGLASTPSGASYLRLSPELARYSSTLPLLVIENFGAGPIPSKGWNSTGAGIRQVPRQTATWATFDRIQGVSSFGSAPQMIGLIGIRERGAYSSEWRQKPYSVEALDESGAEADATPLDMPAHSDWVLYYPDAEVSRDPTLLFNTLAYDLSRSFGQYSVRFRWVEAFVNEDGGDLTLADRRGVYAIVERVARGRDRLDFERLSADGTQGGWLLNINRMDPEPAAGWPAPNGATQPWFFRTAGPDRRLQSLPNTLYSSVPGDDQPQQPNAFINFDNPSGYVVSPTQRAAIERWFRQFEDVLYDDALWRDPTRGYRAWIESRNFIDYFVLNTLTKNGDGLLISLFPWKGDDGRLRIGPAWDYNWAAYYVSGGPTGSLLHRSDRLWYPRLFADPDFAQDYLDRWWELRAGPLANPAIAALVDRQAAEISTAKALLNGMPSASEWTRRLNELKGWLRQRANWIDTQYIAPPRSTPDPGPIAAGTSVALTSGLGTIYFTTDGTDPRAPGGSIADTARAYQAPLAIDRRTHLRARARQGTRWSGLLSAHYETPQDLHSLRLSEVMYHPAPFEPWTEADLEFVELHNAGSQSLDLGGLSFTEGIRFTFTHHTQLEAGAYLVLARNPEALRARYPGLVAFSAFSGQLDNAGEALQLTDARSNLLLRVVYDDRSPWPAAADGTGRSLVPRDDPEASPDPATSTHWRASTAEAGSPGAGDPPFFVLQPLDQPTVPGQPVTLSLAVHPAASLPLQVRWRQPGSMGASPVLTIASHVAFHAVPSAPLLSAPTLVQAVVANAEHPDGLPTRIATVALLADADGDGLPDLWESEHGLDPAQTGDEALDRDHDGATELAEFLAGTHPTDPESVLRTVSTRSGRASFDISFESRRGRTYALEATDSLAAGTWTVVAELPAENESRTRSVPLSAGGAARYLRLVTPRP